MNPKDGSAGSPVDPAEPEAAQDADVADPGEMAEIKAEQLQTESGKYGTQEVTPFKPPETEEVEQEETERSWIEIELVGEDDQPIPGAKYEVTVPDGSVKVGTLDHKGLARVEGFEKGDCTISFPDLDQDAWEFIESV